MTAPEIPASPVEAGSVNDGRPRCRCGHHRDHFMVSPVAHYTFFGWFLVILGISAPMTYMDFQCRECDQVIETTTDAEVMEGYRYRA